MSDHLFDEAVQLQALGEGRFSGAAHPAWQNMVGPFGGITAATALNAVLQHPKLLGAPVTLTVNYLSALKPAPFELLAQPVATNRSTQHWTISLTQQGEDGGTQTVFTGTAVTAVRRPTWGATEARRPEVAAPGDLRRAQSAFKVAWLERYDLRVVSGALPETMDDHGTHTVTRQWMRDEPARPLDVLSLTALCDAFYPRAWLRRARLVPAGTVAFTVYFHASAQELADTGSGWLLGEAQASRLADNFADQAAHLWNEAGVLLATTHQLAYYKE